MAWVYLDDKFPEHEKILEAGGDAGWLFVCALAYCRRNKTAGVVPKKVVPRLSDRRKPLDLAGKLVDVHLFEDRGDHFRIHDYDEWNRSAEEEERKRSERAARAARARWDAAKSNGTHAPSNARASAEAMPDPCLPLAPTPAPSVNKPLHNRKSVDDPEHGLGNPNVNDNGRTAELAGRMAACCKGRGPKIRAEAIAVVAHCLAHVDWRLVDETIGWAEKADKPPVMPRYFVPAVRRRAADVGVLVPLMAGEREAS